MDAMIEQGLAAFSPISLSALNAKAEMLDRLDNKYILPGDRLQPAMAAITEMFDVLEIDGKRAFAYSTCYFDDANRRGYYDHHQRRRKRCKVRVRHYVDAGFSYLEVKLNEKRAMTSKRRLRIESPLSVLDDRCMDFVDHCYRDCYGESFVKPLQPVIVINYERVTLVAKEGGERLTIDTCLGFQTADGNRAVPADRFIVETKSARGNGIADKVLRALHVQPTRRVSKFCIGMAATGQVVQHNGFLPALRKLDLVDSRTRALLRALSPSCRSVFALSAAPRIHQHAPTFTNFADDFAVAVPACAGG